ncbi:MAG: zf-HC2 domain-containing protein [Clostridia bacterium]|nr:zf-HC2 domain-containing protein [Clostridia bacterium]
MDCNIIKDLIPLYIDNCCSDEACKAVKEHIEECPDCKSVYEDMNSSSLEQVSVQQEPLKLKRVNDWKASILQSVLLFISFAVITLGVALEARTPYDYLLNGFWAFSLVIPATGFMLSLANWYFIRLYSNKKVFSGCSSILTLVFTVSAFIWAGFHYEFSVLDFFDLLGEMSGMDFFECLIPLNCYFGIGMIFTIILCILSKVMSDVYAKTLGKE